MKRDPKRQGLCLWHWRELTVIWEARCEAAATMYTASYIRAASVWKRNTGVTITCQAGITNHALHLSHQDCWCTASHGFSKHTRKLQCQFYKLHGEQSKQPGSAILFKVPFWLYTQSEGNNCCILTTRGPDWFCVKVLTASQNKLCVYSIYLYSLSVIRSGFLE